MPKYDHDYNVYIAVYRREEDPRQINIDIERRPDGFFIEKISKKGNKVILGTLTIPGSNSKVKLVGFQNMRKNIPPPEPTPDVLPDPDDVDEGK